MSTPFHDRPMTLTQPDGTPVEVIGTGNQSAALFHLPDGRPVVRNPDTGFYEYAALEPTRGLVPLGARAVVDAVPPGAADVGTFGPAELNAAVRSNPGLPTGQERWRTRCERKRLAPAASLMPGIFGAPPQRETVGSFVGLCLLIEFPDVQGTISVAEVDAFLNQVGYSGFGNKGSVRDYFLEVSGGKVDYTNVVAPYYKAKHPRAYYTDRTIDQPIRAWELIHEALDHLAQSGFDFSPLTADDEEYVYAVNVYYAGPVVNNWAEGLWPHAYNLQQPRRLATGRKAYDYQFTNMGAELTLGTFVHENGHMVCDFPDLYDYERDKVASRGVGDFCLMCGGANVDPKNPVHVGGYLKYRAGWATERPLAPGAVHTLLPSGNELSVHRRNAHEYFVLENRQRLGRDAALPSAGLAIWHVDEKGSNEHQGGTPNLHYECALEQADGKLDLERNRNDGDPGDLFPNGGKTSFGVATTPSSRWWSGAASGLELADITDAGGAVTFRVVAL